MKTDKADNFDHRNVTVEPLENSRHNISWPPPADPNGVIITYELEMSMVDDADVSEFVIKSSSTIGCSFSFFSAVCLLLLY